MGRLRFLSIYSISVVYHVHNIIYGLFVFNIRVFPNRGFFLLVLILALFLGIGTLAGEFNIFSICLTAPFGIPTHGAMILSTH